MSYQPQNRIKQVVHGTHTTAVRTGYTRYTEDITIATPVSDITKTVIDSITLIDPTGSAANPAIELTIGAYMQDVNTMTVIYHTPINVVGTRIITYQIIEFE